MSNYVAHIIQEYLGHTLNWVYTQIKYTTRYRSFVLTGKMMNLDSYPVENIFCPFWKFPSMVGRIFFRLGHRPLNDEWCYQRAIRQMQPKLIHAHFGWDGYFSLDLRRRFNIPLITRFYGYDVGILPRLPMWQRRYRRLFSEGDLFITEGQGMKRSLIEMGCPSDKIIVHHLGIELDKIQYRCRQPLSGKFRVLMAATLKEKKGYEYGFRALRRAVSELRNLDVSIRIIGDGILRPSLKALAGELGISDRIEWCGYKDPAFFYRALYEADLFLAPSVTGTDGDTEGGSPVAVIEACASGLPVISTTHADIPEVIIHGENGLLAPERDIDQLAQAIVRVALDCRMRTIFGEKARAHIEKNYNAVTQGRALNDIYDHAINTSQLKQ